MQGLKASFFLNFIYFHKLFSKESEVMLFNHCITILILLKLSVHHYSFYIFLISHSDKNQDLAEFSFY